MRALAALLSVALSACAVERTRGLSVVAPREEALVVDEGGPWREVAATEGEPAAPASVATAPRPAPAAAPAPQPRPSVASSAPRRTEPAFLPERRPAEAATATGPTLPSDRHLDHPTKVRAQRITLRLPARHAGSVVRSAESTTNEAEGRVVLAGHARVTCRQLTLEADRIVLETQKPGVEDVAIVARGDVSFVTDQKGQVLREEHVRSLLVTNDRVTPLR